jgi:hypothetical protein
MRALNRWLMLVAVVLGITLGIQGRSEADTITFNTNLNVWNPIGSSGAVNGGFVSDTATDGNQIGLRAELRTLPTPLPQTNDGINTATYFAPAGPFSPSFPTLSKWDFDFSIDLSATGQTVAAYNTTLTITDRSGLVTPVNLQGPGLIPSTSTLYQNAENPGFSFLSGIFPSFDPNVGGVYSFDLLLTPKSGNGDTLEVKMNVDVAPEPATFTLCGIGIVAICGYAWRRRKLTVI